MITVLTPTYNRAYTLPNAYESLKRQADHNFEWIIVDDGSTDNTEQLVSNWLNENLFRIEYYRQPNGGKHRAVNFGVKKAAGDFILILDSDDTLTEDCIAFFDKHIPEVESDKYAGLAGLRGFSEGEGVIGGQKDDDSYIDATNIERIRLHLGGDKAEAYKTSIMKKYPFPEFQGEKFLAEGAAWNKIALDGYKIRWYNHVLYKCKYLEDGLTKNKTNEVLLNNFNGYTYNTILDVRSSPFPYNYLSIGTYSALAKKKGYHRKFIQNKIGISTRQYIFGYIIKMVHDLTKK